MTTRHKIKVDGVTRVVTTEERDRILAKRSEAEAVARITGRLTAVEEQLADANRRNEWLEKSSKSECDARIKAEREIGGFQRLAAEATRKLDGAECNVTVLSQKLAFAEGFISALKGEPYRVNPSPTNDLDQLFGGGRHG